MQKTLLLLFLATAACNGANSSTDHKTGTGGSGGSLPIGTPPPGTGGSPTANGGESGAPLGGTLGSASGGSAGQAGNGTGGSTLPASTTLGTGGATTKGTGGATVAGLGGMPGMGGSATGSAGAKGMDAAPDVGTSDVGTLPGTGGASGTGGSRGTGGATGAGGATTACVPAASPGQSGMNSGQACLTCHSSGGRMARMPFSAAGTLYASASGGGTVSGATVTIIGSDNKKVTVVTGSDGNFYTDSTIAFPATAQISKCPDTATMSVALTAGDCNSCHGSSMRLHLP